jgi:hypothetical protein
MNKLLTMAVQGYWLHVGGSSERIEDGGISSEVKAGNPQAEYSVG